MVNLFDEPQLAPDAPRGLGAAMVGGNPKVKRQPLDYYPTPPEVTRALLREERNCIASFARDNRVWEPCGRGGAIMRVLAEYEFTPVGTDLVADPDNDVAALDLLQAKRAKSRVVVTNPPFAPAAAMILHLLEALDVDYLALLLKATFWHADERAALFRKHRPARIRALTWRPDFLGGGNPTMECAWFIWQRGWACGTQYSVLPREDDLQECLL